jgi:serine protease Do
MTVRKNDNVNTGRPGLCRVFLLSLLTLPCCMPTIQAQPYDGSDLLLAEQTAFQSAVAAVAPSVVQMETFGGIERLDEKVIADGPITGTIIGKDGWIVSSLYGLRQQPASILVNLPGGGRAPVRIVARDYAREIVLLKVDTDIDLPVVTTSPADQWRVGQWCLALGKTYDPELVTQSTGIISALGRAYGRAVQTDAKVSPINYGGPLIDLHGRVIGILAPIAAGEMLGDDGSVLYDSGIGFAIPLSDIIERLPIMQAGQDIYPGKLGIVTQDQNELAGPVKITGAAPGSPAARAGVKAGDVILSARGRSIDLLADLRHALAEVDAGAMFEFVVDRQGQQVSVTSELVAEIPVYRRRFLGIQVQSLAGGLTVESVIGESPSSVAGLLPGDVIIQCGETSIQNRLELESILASADLNQSLMMRVIRASTAEPIVVSVTPVEWPKQLLRHNMDSSRDADDILAPNKRSEKAELLELKLADIPNKIQAIIPKKLQDRRVGCLVIFSQPGEIPIEKLKEIWEPLATKSGWIILFPTSANPRAWARDEVELASRLLARMDQEYSIDRSRTAMGGVGVGGQMAIMAALTERKRCSGVLTIGTQIQSFGLRQANTPMETIDFLMIGDRQLEAVAERLSSQGYSANWLAVPEWDSEDWKKIPMQSIEQWLESLDYL